MRVTPTPPPELAKRMREHKQTLIHYLLYRQGEQDDVELCRACYCVIRATEPHWALDLDDGTPDRPYHTDPSCRAEVIRLATKLRAGGVYQIHQIHACPDENPGYGCSQLCFG